jgi:hypothetical protein
MLRLLVSTKISVLSVKPLYQGHSREPENVSFMSSYQLILYELFINGKNEADLYRQGFQ